MSITRLAWRNIWRHRRRTLLTSVAMAVGIALCLGYIALTDGMYVRIFDMMVVKQIGHGQLHAKNYPKQRAIHETIREAIEFEKRLRALPDIQATASRVFGYALLGAGDEAAGALLTGIHPGDEKILRDLHDSIHEGVYLPDNPEQKILLGHLLADTLKAKVGSEIVAVTQSADGSLGNELYTVVGLLKTGATAIDRGGAFIHQQDAQSLLALEGQVHEIALLSFSRERVPSMMESVKSAVEPDKILARSWGEVSPTALQWMQMQAAMYFIVAFLVFGVAGLGILNTMLMSVFERTRELGVLIALGLRPRSVVFLILTETMFLTAVSATIGLFLGGVLDWWLVTHGINFGTELDFAGMRWDPILKGEVNPEGIIIIIIGVFFLSALASLWPAVRAARLKPVVAMREQ